MLSQTHISTHSNLIRIKIIFIYLFFYMYNVRLMYVTCLLYNRTIQSIWAHTHWNRRNRYHTIIRPHIQRWNSYKFEDLGLFISLPLELHLPCLVLLKHLNSAVFIRYEVNENEWAHVRSAEVSWITLECNGVFRSIAHLRDPNPSSTQTVEVVATW